MKDNTEENKINAVELSRMYHDAAIPVIGLTPIFTLTERELKNFLFILLQLKDQIEERVGVPIIMNILDAGSPDGFSDFANRIDSEAAYHEALELEDEYEDQDTPQPR